MPELLTPSQASEQSGYSKSSLIKFEKSGALKGVYRTPGNQRRYDPDELAKLSKQVFPAQAVPTDDFTNPKPNRPVTYTELGTTGLARFGGSVVEERLRELQGYSGRIKYREMSQNDPVIRAVLFACSQALRQALSHTRIEPASQGKADQEAAEFVESCFEDMSFTWNDSITFVVEPMLEQGFSLLEIVYKKRLGDNPPSYTDNPAPSRFDDGRIGWRKWSPRPAESLAPGSEWIFDDHGGIQGINQNDNYSTGAVYSIPIAKLLHFRTTVHPANTPEPPPVHRAAYLPYYYTQNFQEIEGIGVERDLNGIPVIYLGEDCSIQGTDSDYEMAKDLVTNIRVDEQSGVVIPKPKMGAGATEGKGMLLELITSGGSRAHDIGAIIERYDKRKALIVLAQFIMLGMEQVGSYALSRHHGDLFVLAARAWVDSIADIINRHAIPRLMKLNSFPGTTGMPKIVPNPVGIPDLIQVAEYVNKLVDKEVITPDEELEKHLRRLADLPDPPEKDESTGKKVSRVGVDKQSLLLNRLRLALEPMEERGLINPNDTNSLLKPTLQRLVSEVQEIKQEQEEAAEKSRILKLEPEGLSPTGRKAAKVTDELQKDIDSQWDRLVKDIAAGVAVGVALSRYRRNTSNLLKDAYTDVWILARGSNFEDSEYSQIDRAAAETGEYLDGFMKELETTLKGSSPEEAQQTLEGRRSRALMYAGAAWALFNLAKTFKKSKGTRWRWVGPGDSRSCEDCKSEIAAGIRPLSKIDRRPGSTACLSNCRCELVEVG